MERGGGEITASDWDDRIYGERLQRIIEDNSAHLTSQERYILDKRFPGESNRKRETLERIGRDIRMSKVRVRQIQVSALEKLRVTLTAEPVLS
jgi:DNA-directed RNA polymerase sigma subunit (sigma70/sigma32)